MTNKIYGTSYIPCLSLSDHIDLLQQMEDNLGSLASDISSIMSEWNNEVYPILSSLPQGVSETRWNLDNTIDPKINGLDGSNIFVDTSAASTTDSGKYWDSTNLRPKTVKESLTNLYNTLNTEINNVRSEITVSSGSGLTAAQKASIGDNIFDSTRTSSASSLDGLTTSNNLHAIQLAKDLYDVTDWSWNSDGSERLTNYSVKDMMDALLVLHGGLWNSDVSVTHDGIGAAIGASYRFIAGGTNTETGSTSDVVVGGFTFDPTEYGTTIEAIEIYFEGELNYIAAGAAGTGYLKLYDMGTPGATGPGTLRSTLERTHAGSNLPDRVRLELTTTASPGVDGEEISNAAKVYEIRLSVDGTGAGTDVIQMTWGGLVIQPV